MRAEIAVVDRAHGQEPTVGIERQFRFGEEVSACVVAERHFAPCAGPLYRSTDALRGPSHKRKLRIAGVPRPIATTDVASDHADPILLTAEGC